MTYTPPHQQSGPGKFVQFLVWPGSNDTDGFHNSQAHMLILPVNPDTQVQRAIRTTATQTIQGAYVDDFGLGIGMLTVSGHTGWQIGIGQYNDHGGYTGIPIDGFTAAQALQYYIIQYYFDLEAQQARQNPAVTMQYFNTIDEQWYTLKPTGPLTVPIRSHSKPYLYQFQAQFYILEDHNHLGAVPPLADPIDPLLTVSDYSLGLSGQSLMGIGNSGTGASGSSPASQALPPPGGIWIVTAGQTLWGIATNYVNAPVTNGKIQAEVNAIAAINHLANPNFIYPGEKLKIPA